MTVCQAWHRILGSLWLFMSTTRSVKNAGRSSKNAGMRERRQNEGFPARLRDGWQAMGTLKYDITLDLASVLLQK